MHSACDYEDCACHCHVEFDSIDRDPIFEDDEEELAAAD
jgi:hypothetical protein